MKTLLVITALTLISQLAAAETYLINGKEVTKQEAMRTALSDREAKIQKVQDVELTDKMTFKVKKTAKNQ